jgi:hypothetical protein
MLFLPGTMKCNPLEYFAVILKKKCLKDFQNGDGLRNSAGQDENISNNTKKMNYCIFVFSVWQDTSFKHIVKVIF